MTDLNKDIVVSGLFLTGLFGFVSGAFIVSSAVFATVAVVTQLPVNKSQVQEV